MEYSEIPGTGGGGGGGYKFENSVASTKNMIKKNLQPMYLLFLFLSAIFPWGVGDPAPRYPLATPLLITTSGSLSLKHIGAQVKMIN